MTKVFTEHGVRLIIIKSEEPRQCELCGQHAECRPYGPNKEQICYECGMKDLEMTNKQTGIVLFGDKEDYNGKQLG